MAPVTNSKISIVIPSFNQGRYVRQCLESVLSQQYPNLEIIVVDGGSTDGTQDVLAEYEPKVSVMIIEPDNGQSDALAKGFALATGDIGCYLNTDDLLLPGAFQFADQFFANHAEVDAVYGDRVFINDVGEITGCWRLPRHVDYLMRRWDYIPQETCFWRMQAYSDVGGIDNELGFAVDFDLFVRFMEHKSMTHERIFLGAFRIHDQSKTQTILETIGREEIDRIRRENNIKHFPCDRLIGKLLRHWVEGASNRFLEQNAAELKALLPEKQQALD